MTFNLVFKVAGEEQLNRSLSRFAEDVKDYSEPFHEIAADFYETERRLFDSEGGTGGAGAWKKLSDNPAGKGYASWKARNFPGAKILHRWENLRDSLTQMGSAWNIREVEPLRLTLGTILPYAIYHQTGRGVPQRKVIDLSESDKERWMKIIQKWLVQKARTEGLEMS